MRLKVGDIVQVKDLAEYVYELCDEYRLVVGRVVESSPHPQTGVLVDVGIELYFDRNELEKV